MATEVDLQEGIFRAFDVDLSFLEVLAIQMSPQRGPRSEDFPPAAAYVGRSDQGFILVTVFPKVGNQGEDFWRGFIGGGEGVLD